MSFLENDKVYDDLHSYLAPLEKMATFDIYSISPLLELIKIDLDDFKYGSPTFKTVLVAMRLLDHIVSSHANAPKGICTFRILKEIEHWREMGKWQLWFVAEKNDRTLFNWGPMFMVYRKQWINLKCKPTCHFCGGNRLKWFTGKFFFKITAAFLV